MDNVVYKLRLEATKPGRQGTVHVVKDDTGTRIIEATITSNGKPLVFGGATVALWANVAGSDQFIAGEILEDQTTARVVLPTTIIEVPGEFDAELRYIETASAHVLTSAKIVIIVEANLYDSEAVEAQDNFDALASYAQMAHNAVEHYPRISGETGNWEVYDAENEEWDDTGVHAKGDKGDTGATGQPGADGKDGKDGADGKDGQDGSPGQDGTDGQDGVSPEVTIASITGGHSVTITDADHPSGRSFDVMDGEDGEDGNKITFGTEVTVGGQTTPAGDNYGDTYINTQTLDVYEWHFYSSIVSAWLLIGNISGRGWMFGTEATTDGQRLPLVHPGTVYCNTNTYDIYVCEKPAGAGTRWTYKGNIKGAKGDPGENGQDGADGYTPVRGVDYWTAADQAAIVADVEADVAPKVGAVTLSSSWTAGAGVYTQAVTISGVTADDAIDLYPDATVIAQMVSDGVSALYIDNNNGVLTAVCVGAALTASVSVQYRVTKVAAV